DVIVVDTIEELAGVAADGGAVAEVGGAETSGHHAANVLARLEQGDGLALAGRRDGGDDTAGRRPINDDIGLLLGGLEGRSQADCQQCRHQLPSTHGVTSPGKGVWWGQYIPERGARKPGPGGKKPLPPAPSARRGGGWGEGLCRSLCRRPLAQLFQ